MKKQWTEAEKEQFAAKHEAAKKDFTDSTATFFTELLDEIKQGKTSRLTDYLAFIGKQHKYSPLNQVWIWSQCQKRGIRPTFLRSYSAWKNSGCHLAAGAKGIMVTQPHPIKYTKLNKNTGEDEEAGWMDYKIAYTFDVSMLDEESQAKWHENEKKFFDDVEAPVEDVVAAMEAALLEQGIPVERKAQSALGQSQGWSESGKIVLKDGIPVGNQLLTLAHEWAHEKLHWEKKQVKFTAQEREQQAALVEYLFGQHFGIQSPYSRDYLLNWGASVQTIQAHFESVQSTLIDVIQATGKQLRGDDDEVAA